jgi:hypothetical protein
MKTLPPALLAATLALASFPSLAAAAPCGTENLLAGKKPSASQAVKGDVGQVTDGTVSPEGAQWDSSTTVALEGTTSSITYDLGEAREISAVVAQADANDTYKVMGSADGSPASYKLITELANVVNTGHGLRTRAVQVPPTTVRFVRIGDANGDNYFTVSEFAVFCKAPTPFPPGMKIVDAPPVANPDAQTTPKPGSDTGRWALLLTAVALALAWLAYKTITRPAAGSGDTTEAGAKPADKTDDKPPTDDKPAT